MPATANLDSPAPLAELREADIVSTRSSTVTVLERVNWRILPGELWVVGSLPGTGKSALLQTVAGIQGPGAGEVRLFGQELGDLAEPDSLRQRLRLGVVFEGGGHFFSQLTVAENITLAYCYHHNCPVSDAGGFLEKVLALTELTDYAGYRPARVPRTLCPRIGLARALLTGPELLLLDNPLHGLDARQRNWWLGTLARLAREGQGGGPLAMVVAVDDLKTWLELGNRFALIKERRLVVYESRAALEASQDALLHDLLALGPDSE